MQPELQPAQIRTKHAKAPKEWKLIALRECPLPEAMQLCDTPERAADYWRTHVVTTPHYDPERECFVVLMLNTRRRIRGHHFVTIGTNDSLIAHPREVFRVAIVAASAAIVLMHNHPSGEPTPSDSDIKVTRDLIKAGQLIKIEVLDHVIIGRATNERQKDYTSLRELGYFYA